MARGIPDRATLTRHVAELGLELLLPVIRKADDGATAFAVDAAGHEITVRPQDGKLNHERAFGPFVRVSGIPPKGAPRAFLGIRLKDIGPAKPGAIRLATRTENGAVALLDSGTFSPDSGMLIALITANGDYQAVVAAAGAISDWHELGPTLDASAVGGIGRITQLDVHPTDGDVVIAAAAGGGVWRTDDAGASWRPLTDREESLTMGAVAFAPSNPDVIYAAAGEDASPYNPAWPGLGIFTSLDGGQTWPRRRIVESKRFSAIAVHPWWSSVAYAAGNVGLYMTINRGRWWTLVFEGRITDVVIDPFAPHRVYIGVYRRGVYRATDGYNFFPLVLDGALPQQAHGYIKLAIGRGGTHGSQFLVAKLGQRGELIYTSIDGGNNWSQGDQDVASSDEFAEWTSLIAVDPQDEQRLYAGQRFKLRRSAFDAVAGKLAWTPIDTAGPKAEILHPDHQDLGFDPNNPARLYLANDGGVYRSANHGTTWEWASGGLNVAQLHDLDISQANPDVIACGAQESGIHYGVCQSDGTWRWSNLDFRFDGTRVAIDAADPKIVYCSSQTGIQWALQNKGSLGRALDAPASPVVTPLGTGGLSGSSPFVTVLTLDPDDTLANPANQRKMFLGGSRGLIPHLFRSQDGGASWTRVEDGTGAPFVPEGEITAIEFAPTSTGVVYLGTSLGAVYRATNGGATTADWTRINGYELFGVQVSAIASAVGDPAHIWVVFAGDGVTFTDHPTPLPSHRSHVFKTVDGGANWHDASGGLFTGLPRVPASAVVLDDQQLHFGRAYVGTDVGVFMTIDGGETWCQIARGLPCVPVTRLRLHRNGRWLYAATMGRGAFRCKLD